MSAFRDALIPPYSDPCAAATGNDNGAANPCEE